MPRASSKKPSTPMRSSTEIRAVILRYFYDRNAASTSARGKRGYAVRILDVRRELKASHGLSLQEVMSNLNYLLSQGWVAEDKVEKSVPLPSGTVIPNTTSYYKITAAGIDKIDGPGEFTMDKFKGIRIEATGQNIITVGDGNQVNSQHQGAAGALVDLKQALLKATSLTEAQKLDAVADIDSIQSQLAKASPNGGVMRGAWEAVKKLEAVAALAEKVVTVAKFIAPFIGVGTPPQP